MKNLYDVQQFLKRFGIIIYVGKRLYDIELMKIELASLWCRPDGAARLFRSRYRFKKRTQAELEFWKRVVSVGNIIVWLAILGVFGWMALLFRIRKAAKFVDNATFEELIRQGQLIDLREPAEFHAKHILES